MAEDYKELSGRVGTLRSDIVEVRTRVHNIETLLGEIRTDVKTFDTRIGVLEGSRSHVWWTLGITLPIIFAILIGGGAMIGSELWHLNGSIGILTGEVSTLNSQVSALTPNTAKSLLRIPNPTPETVAENTRLTAALIESARNNKIHSDDRLLMEVGQDLTKFSHQFPGVNSVWTAGAQLVSYRSELGAVALKEKQLPSCLEIAPTERSNFENIFNSGGKDVPNTKLTPFVFEDCKLELEQLPQLFDKYAHMSVYNPGETTLKGRLIPPYVFRRSVIMYHGGALPDSGIAFEHCLFQIEVDSEPPPRSRQVLEAILAAPNLSDVSVPASGQHQNPT